MRLLLLSLIFFFGDLHESKKESSVIKDFNIKWKLIPLPDNKFKIIIDAKKESEEIEFSDFHFVIDYYKADGSLITTETVDYSPKKTDLGEGFRLRESLSGGNETSKVFQYYHNGVSTIKGKKLLFHWFNHGIMFEPPDRNHPKPIPEDVLYGDASVGLSQ